VPHASGGLIIEGKSTLDESMITGESGHVGKGTNDAVIGATVNQAGSFLMRVEKVGAETLLSQIVRMVAEAQHSRAPIQRLADTVAGYFVPAVILSAVITFIVWAALGPKPGMAYAQAVVWVASNGTIAGVIGISDPIKQTTPGAYQGSTRAGT
jgi:Cu+-exporting ATPase